VNSPDTRLELLFVCTANICRSAFAAELGRHLSSHIGCSSAGTRGFDSAPMDPPMAHELAARGVDATGFRSRALTPAMLREADLVLTMEVAHRTWILGDAPELVAKVFTLAQFANAVSAADPALTGRGLLDVVRHNRGHARASLDVADPYAGGPAAAEAAAAHIDRLLRSFLPRL